MNEMKELPLISVITTVYNTEKYVERCFDSIMEQTYPNIEFIVVNNGSGGNIEEIVEQYQKAYPKRIIRIKSFEENQGVYHARVAGADLATGKYIAFIDSDDRVSVDYYRHLVAQAEESGADIVVSDVVYEKPSGELYYQNHNPWHRECYELCGESIFDFYMTQEGSLFSANFIWNKLISAQLWKRAHSDICSNQRKIVMYDDMALNAPIYYYAEKMIKTAFVQYYYYQNSSGNSKGSSSAQRYMRIIGDIENSFAVIEDFLEKHELPCYKENVVKWKQRYYRTWEEEIEKSKLSRSERHRLITALKNVLGGEISSNDIKNVDKFFYDTISPFGNDLENQIKKIIDSRIEYVSFDVFDTLVVRPTFEPADVFNVLGEYVNQKLAEDYYIDFRTIRIEAERQARAEVFSKPLAPEDIAIETIYEKLGTMLPISHEELAELMEREIALEKALCKYRPIGKYLYEIASAAGKKIVCISDMYLHGNSIQDLLKNCGYQNVTAVFASSDILLTKNSGSLYKYVLSQLNIKPSAIIHVGDNFHSDICMARKAGISVIHLISGRDNMIGSNKLHYHGEFTERTYFGNFDGNCAYGFWGIRNQLGLVANKIFDDPFEDYNPYSDFNGSPYALGYYVLGSYELAVCLWLKEQIRGKGYKKIHFIARDGWIFKQAYDEMFANAVDMPKSNYLRVSRKALFPLAIKAPEDLFTVYNFYNIHAFTPRKVIKCLEPIIPQEKRETANDIMRNNGMILDKKFASISDWKEFASIFEECIYDQNAVDVYRDEMKGHFSSIFTDCDCTFDAGYGGRTESILTRLLDREVDAYYLHVNEARSLESSRKLDFSIHALHPVSASVPRMVFLETLISEIGGTCIGYEKDPSGKIEPVLGKTDLNFQSMHTFGRIHTGALDFIKEWVEFFEKTNVTPALRYQDLLLPLHSFIRSAKLCEKYLFSAAFFDDPLFFDNVQSVQTVFEQLQKESSGDVSLVPAIPEISPKWKMALVLLLVDRKTLKEKVKRKYAAHPVFLKFLKVCYSIPRSIYHLIKRWG